MESKTLQATLVLALTLAIGVPAFAAKMPALKKGQLAIYDAPENVRYAPLDEETLAKIADESKERRSAQRSPAQASTADFNKIILQPLLDAKTPDALDDVLASFAPWTRDASGKLVDRPEFQAYAPEVKYFAAQMALIRPLRSIVYRLKDLVEKENKPMQSMAVTVLKGIAANMKIYVPSEHWQAGFDYITRPSGNAETNKKYTSISQLQGDLARYTDYLNFSAKVIKGLYEKNSNSLPFVWDKAAQYHKDAYRDPLDRYAHHWQSEVAATMASLHMARSSIWVFAAYNHEDMLKVWKDIAKTAGMDGFLVGRAIRDGDLGISSENRYKAIMHYGNYQKLRTGAIDTQGRTAKTYMRYAFWDLKQSITWTKNAWDTLQGNQDRPQALMNPVNFVGDKREVNLRLQKLVDMTNVDIPDQGETAVSKPTPLFSVVEQQSVTVDIPKFYTDPPTDMKELLAFVHEDGEPEITKSFNVRVAPNRVEPQDHTFRNYYLGRPIAWKPKWKDYVPSLQTETIQVRNRSVQVVRMDNALKLMQQSWGGDYIAPVFDTLSW